MQADGNSGESAVQCFIGLGSNLSPRRTYLQNALRHIDTHPGCRVAGISSVYETMPLGEKAGTNFLNMVAEVYTILPPKELFLFLKDIEKTLGRLKRERWADREIDLDILLYGNVVLDADELTIPHAALHARDFVLIPLLELNPNLVDPANGERLAAAVSVLTEHFIIRKFRERLLVR
jgi:2-amino-4-hydroxy-6-hydroxymethyldihydropteridine diphosphokinase